MANILTIEAAKEYVREYHERIGETVDIEGAGIFYLDGIEVCRLNCTVGGEADRFVAQWDVWVEPSELYGPRLYGEF